ncbi:Imm27 family immunity protein [Roseixanthobacter finlandensis]|uniref:Imm27 family immunity protein n=1 Tax=Roseixanthobacter finlandensis TaxID=3119922 RepID=UPI00372D789E
MSIEGDAAEIDALLSTELIHLAATEGGWRKLYRHRATGSFWELSYPQSEMHGGGPRRLRELSLTAPEQWR